MASRWTVAGVLRMSYDWRGTFRSGETSAGSSLLLGGAPAIASAIQRQKSAWNEMLSD